MPRERVEDRMASTQDHAARPDGPDIRPGSEPYSFNPTCNLSKSQHSRETDGSGSRISNSDKIRKARRVRGATE